MSNLRDVSRLRQIVTHLMLLVLWALLAVTAVGTFVGFAHSLRSGLEVLGALGVIIGVTALATEPAGLPK